MKLIGLLRVKNEARWLERVLESIRPACERILVLDDHSDDGTPFLAARIPGVTVFDSPFAGLDEPRDKDYLLGKAWEAGAELGDCCLMIDGDEELVQADIPLLHAALAGPGDCWDLRVLYLWNREDQVRVDGHYGKMCRPSMFRLTASDLRFARTNYGGGFHCSNAPYALWGDREAIPARLLHYGYLHQEDRMRKYLWYNERDPGNQFEDTYRHMVIGDLFPAHSRFRHGGPLRLEALQVEAMRQAS